ncbi:ABC transporter ATP-binding protein [Corticimicrobacter populi]|uniref:ABC transporter ATP-binding protein n=1 Tax=Corticimicrobacter populi TaxID=2175229 RepID=A0A2V1K1F3_9BURK|nr:ABC transporter ATP-binding protein [Corticimicrobacter populi]PWF22606.1 ABC transporter ATP-binding protein [Corticimicrobacter populi]QDQ86503.1 ABC transporter ATP-binding protein [Alcaligenaceae bacterium SJ-26]
MSDDRSRQSAPVLAVREVRKSYHVGLPTESEVLHGVSFELAADDFCALVGPSGSGKTSLLNLVAQLDTPTQGEIELLGHPTRGMQDQARTLLRRRALGFVFQFHHLIPAFTALENVLMPCMIDHGKPRMADRERALALLQDVGLGDFAHKLPTELSGGQQQRVAIARALVTHPPLLVADEPTGNLDTQTAESIFALFRRFHEQLGCAVLIVTHDQRLSSQADRLITLVDGRIAGDCVR